MSEQTNTDDLTVSVVIPVYNCEEYLSECLDSILAQRVPLQVICVDDGSTDRSPQILARYEAEHECITVVRKENGGQSRARNEGLTYVTGAYTYFIDADDVLAAGALEELVALAEATNADIVYFDADSFFESAELEEAHGTYRTYYHRTKRYLDPRSGIDMMCAMSAEGDWLPSPVLQLFRSEFVRAAKLAFVPGIIHEDNAFTYHAAVAARVVTHIDRPLYLRRVRTGSTMTVKGSARHIVGYFTCFLDMLEVSERVDVDAESQAMAIPYDCLVQARRVYREVGETERVAALREFEGRDRLLFEMLVVRDKWYLDEMEGRGAELEAIKASKAYSLAQKISALYRRIASTRLPNRMKYAIRAVLARVGNR